MHNAFEKPVKSRFSLPRFKYYLKYLTFLIVELFGNILYDKQIIF